MDEIEVKLIGSILTDKFLLINAIKYGLNKDLFEENETKVLANYIIKTYAKTERTIDIDTLVISLQEEGIYNEKMKLLLEEAQKVKPISLETLVSLIEILKKRKAEKELLKISEKIKNYIESKQKVDITEFSGNIINEIRGIIQGRVRKTIKPVRTQLIIFSSEVANRTGTQSNILGYSLDPYTCLTESLSGARRGFYYALAGAPRRGKTNFMLKLATHIAKNENIPVLYYSWEQTSRVLFLRIFSQESLIPPYKLETADIANDPVLAEKFNSGYAKIEEYMNYLYLIEGGREDTVNKIRSHAFSVMQENETDKVAIFIDYLQKVPTTILYQDLAQQVDEVSGGLANLSLELNCPIFAISSFDKEGVKLDSEESKVRPTMFNCTGGGDIEYDSDVAMVIVKDFKDTRALEEKIENAIKEGRINPKQVPHFEILNLHIDKNRDAPFGGNIIIQYLFLIEDNNLVEIGYKNLEEERTYAKVSRLFDWMMKKGYLQNMRGDTPINEEEY